MGGKTIFINIQGHKRHNPAQSEIQVRKSRLPHERRTCLGRCFVGRGQPHLRESEALEIRNRLFKVLPPAECRVFGFPRKELDLSKA